MVYYTERNCIIEFIKQSFYSEFNQAYAAVWCNSPNFLSIGHELFLHLDIYSIIYAESSLSQEVIWPSRLCRLKRLKRGRVGTPRFSRRCAAEECRKLANESAKGRFPQEATLASIDDRVGPRTADKVRLARNGVRSAVPADVPRRD